MKKLILLLPCLCLAGCSFVIANKEGFRAVAPAWPWQDSSRVLERLSVASSTNRFTASVRGLSDSEVTSSNAVGLIEGAARGAAKGAVEGGKLVIP